MPNNEGVVVVGFDLSCVDHFFPPTDVSASEEVKIAALLADVRLDVAHRWRDEALIPAMQRKFTGNVTR